MINTILAESNKPDEEIVIGTPATFLLYSDRSPGVVAVHSSTCIEIASVEARAKVNPHSKDGKYQYGEYIEYDYFPDLSKKVLFTQREKMANTRLKDMLMIKVMEQEELL